MVRKTRFVVALIVLAFLPVAVTPAQETANLGDLIRETGAHKISGFVTLGLATAAAASSFFGEEVHEPLAYATTGMSVVTLTLGTIAYADYFPVAWPHIVLNALGTTAFLINAFALEGGSTAHIATGAAGIASMFAALGAIVMIMR